MSLDIIGIGDASEDVFLQLIEASVHCEINKDRCQLCMNYADKIPISGVVRSIGGNSSNLAVGMSRLGFKSAHYVVLGKDDQGKKIVDAMKADKVSTKYVVLNPKTMTNHSTILNLEAERTILIYHVERKYKLPKFEKADWVYYSSMGHGFEVIHKDLMKYLKKYKPKFGFNPGTHQMRNMKAITPFLKLSDIILLNKEETQLVCRTKSNDFKVLLKKLYNFNKKIVVVTDGPNGSYTYDGEQFLKVGIWDVPVVERTGCGDSYSTGFIAAIMRGKSVSEAMRWGTLNASSVIQQVGPQPGLIKKAALQKLLTKSKKKLQPKPF